MKVFYSNSDFASWRKQLAESTASIGFVPTMGALHEGHVALIERACKENDYSICSIYVNPTQFNNSIDLEKYPRNLEKDLGKLSSFSNLIVFHPKDEDIYPTIESKEVPKLEMGTISTVMEGENRPGHFEGVLTVIKRFFEILEPTRAYFGLKDYQQYLVVKKLAEVYFQKVEIVPHNIIRSEKGLALSSRNERLTDSGIIEAEKLNGYLRNVLEGIKNGNARKSLFETKRQIVENSRFSLEYLTIADASNLIEIEDNFDSEIRVFIAAWVDNVRLIDNMGL